MNNFYNSQRLQSVANQTKVIFTPALLVELYLCVLTCVRSYSFVRVNVFKHTFYFVVDRFLFIYFCLFFPLRNWHALRV